MRRTEQFNLVVDSRRFRASIAAAGFRSAAALARQIGIHRVTMGLYIAGGLVPRPERRAQIAAALGVHESLIWRPALQASSDL